VKHDEQQQHPLHGHLSEVQLALWAASDDLFEDLPCAECRLAIEEIRAGQRAIQENALPLVTAPDAVWTGIEQRLLTRTSRPPIAWWWAASAAAVLVLSASLYLLWERRATTTAPSGWQLADAGAVVGSGAWIDTMGKSSTALLRGSIGEVEVLPETRLRVQQRMFLEQGRIRARVYAAPRIFQVETAAGTAVDLGCEYELVCDRAGNGYLRVTQGWVAYEWKGQESLVPAGASCRTRKGSAPGLPVFEDASAGMLRLVEQFDVSQDGSLLAAMLGEARARDTLTLWHLLTRVEVARRAMVLDRMLALTPNLPAGVTREAILALDREAMRRWREELAWTW